jgi:uncharacterized damage-inducible protein DinB
MRRRNGFIAGAMCVASITAVRAQTTYPYIGELKQNYGIVKNNLVRMAERMPEEHFGFKPAKEVRSFGESVAHVADSQSRSCSLVNGGEPRLVDAASKTTKADLIAALRESFAVCDSAFDALTDAGAGQMVRLGQSTRKRSKLGLLVGVVSHSNEQYGYMSVYMRLKGLVPPSSEGQ